MRTKATALTVSLTMLALCSSCVGEMKKSTTAQQNNNQTSVTTPTNNQAANNQTTANNNQTSPPANNQTIAPPDPDYIERVGSIELTANIPTLTVGQGTALSVKILDKEGNPMELVSLMWTSSDPEVATADGTGIVRAIGVGEVEISATIGDITSNTISLTVAPAPPRQDPALRISPARVGLSVGDVLPLNVEVRRGGLEEVTNELISWKVEDDSIATIDEEGHLTAVAVGSTQATATYEGVSSAPVEVLVTDTPDYYAVDVDNPTGHVNVGGALTIQASFKSYATGDKPGFGVPYQPEQVELVEGEQVLGTITPGYGLAVGEVDLSGLSDGAHDLRLRATIQGNTVLSPTFTVSKLQPVMDYWQDFAPNETLRGENARLFETADGLMLLAHTCARECSVKAYRYNDSNDRWEEIRFSREYHRNRDGAVETSVNQTASLDLPVYVGWGWPSADARQIHTPNALAARPIVAFSNRDAFRSFNDEAVPDHYWFDCHVARWNDSAGQDGNGGWDLLSNEDPDYLYMLPHPSTFPENKQRHPQGVNAVRLEDCRHPRVALGANDTPIIAHISSVVPGTEHSVEVRQWDGNNWTDLADALDITGFDPVLHAFVLDTNSRPVISVDGGPNNTPTIWQLGMSGSWSQIGADETERAITSLRPLQGGGLLGGGIANGDASVYLSSGNTWLALGDILDVSPWAQVFELEVLEAGGEFFAAWVEGPAQGNRDIFVARWLADSARWELLGGGPVDLQIDEDASNLQIALDAQGHLLVRYTVTDIEGLAFGEHQQSSYYQRVRRSSMPLVTSP
jgi:uncharacterized protein YjdB